MEPSTKQKKNNYNDGEYLSGLATHVGKSQDHLFCGTFFVQNWIPGRFNSGHNLTRDPSLTLLNIFINSLTNCSI